MSVVATGFEPAKSSPRTNQSQPNSHNYYCQEQLRQRQRNPGLLAVFFREHRQYLDRVIDVVAASRRVHLVLHDLAADLSVPSLRNAIFVALMSEGRLAFGAS